MADLQMIPFIDDTIEDNGKRKPNEEEFCREVKQKFTLYVGQEFLEIEEAVTFYKMYAIACGFDLKIGATKTYKMLKEHVNEFQNIGASLTDFKNFHRDVKCYIYERDAIWADGIARRNYSVFGDGVSFDPTYTTNKYDMAFTPFTGVDHHKRLVTFCGALVAHEDVELFQWVFSRFLATLHRYCMWHIMNKVPNKYGVTRDDYSEFLKKLNAIIWDEDIKAAEFDAKWKINRQRTRS
ncbi:protein FAR-RED IMPAIRED RESPONSE 1-like [Silene latifolia]|uniref:protein FAR-RED IMPAIRED RESPONSE 1-like n=1 Tax=Silene latifolia TaxID=37657 RepID=UPI003D7822DB